jgi:hypothetical protein
VNHRIVTVVVGMIITMLVGTALAFAWSVQARVPASLSLSTPVTIPHPITARNDSCTACHAGAGVPLTHRYFTNAACPSCHTPRAIILVPHSVSMGNERCPLCHGDPDSDLGMPRDHLTFHERRCLFCHDGDGAKASIVPRPAGASASVKPPLTHPITGAFVHCLYCHRIGSNPSLPASHESFAEETCVWCHMPASLEATGTATK